jgi:hypothetical protein
MTMTPGARKFALTAHVTSSVGWLGSVAGFLALAIAGLTSQDAQMVRAAYLATELITWFVIVPLAFASLLTGLVVALGTQWGLFRHYWVLIKFVLTILATFLLLLHTRPIGLLADVARETTLSGADVRRLQIQLVGDAGAALLALLVNVTLSIYKPRGVTPYEWRKQHERRTVSPSIPTPLSGDPRITGETRMADVSSSDSNSETGYDIRSTPRWVKVFGIIVIVVVLLFRFGIRPAAMVHEPARGRFP